MSEATDLRIRYAARIDPSDWLSAVTARTGEPEHVAPTAFPQSPGMLDPLLGPALQELPFDENAFSLRIQAPPGARNLPVLLFVPGGGFTTGSGHARWYDAAALVAERRFVLVTVNYRLGPFGHAGDLVEAVRWVGAHVERYGGDPSRITLGGDSAGAWYAWALSTTEALRGVIWRTLLVSMPRLAPLAADDDRGRRALFTEGLGGRGLDEVSAAERLAAQARTSRAYTGAGFAFTPAASALTPAWLGEYAVAAPRLHAEELLLLSTREESAAFLRPRRADFPDSTAYRTAVEDATEEMFASVVRDITAHAVVPTTSWRLDVQSPLSEAYSPHCFVLPFLFGGRRAWADAPMLVGLDPALHARTRATVQDTVARFVAG